MQNNNKSAILNSNGRGGGPAFQGQRPWRQPTIEPTEPEPTPEQRRKHDLDTAFMNAIHAFHEAAKYETPEPPDPNDRKGADR